MLSAPVEVYALAMVPALLWGLAPVFSKRGMSAGGGPLQAALVVVAVDSTLYWLALVALYVLNLLPSLTPDRAAGAGLFPGLTLGTLALFVVAGFIGTALGRIAVFAGVDRVGASVNSAAISTRPLFATLLAVLFLGEAPSLLTAAGVVVLVGGLVVLALAKGGDIEGWEPRDLLLPVSAAAMFAVGNVLRRYGFETTATTSLEAVALNETAALVALTGYAVVRGRTDLLEMPRRTYGYFAVSGTLTAVALVSLFAAFRHPAGRVVVVDPLAATAPLFTAVFAYFLLGDLERVTRGVVAGAVFVVAGAALVTIG
ncbi:MAG: EamA family transporter [Haloarculaceae archaeon]